MLFSVALSCWITINCDWHALRFPFVKISQVAMTSILPLSEMPVVLFQIWFQVLDYYINSLRRHAVVSASGFFTVILEKTEMPNYRYNLSFSRVAAANKIALFTWKAEWYFLRWIAASSLGCPKNPKMMIKKLNMASVHICPLVIFGHMPRVILILQPMHHRLRGEKGKKSFLKLDCVY